MTAVCLGNLDVQQVDLAMWSDVPPSKRCSACQLVMNAAHTRLP
jgi:hypothetical protein